LLSSEIEKWESVISKHSSLKVVTEIKSQILFLRSLFISMTMITSSMNNFIHNFLPLLIHYSFRLSAIVTSIQQLDNTRSDDNMFDPLSQNINNFLTTIIDEIPIRLLLTHLSTIIKECFSKLSSASSKRCVEWIHQFIISGKIDRNSLISNLSIWITLSIDLLNYRCQYHVKEITEVTADDEEEDEDDDLKEIESVSKTVITEISLKLTEKELKSFLLKILDWKNRSSSSAGNSDEQEEKEEEGITNMFRTKKVISFYSLVNELASKLKFLFNPTMNLLWDDYYDQMNEIKDSISSFIEKAVNASESKKRKKLVDIKSKLSLKENHHLLLLQKCSFTLLSLIQSLSDSGRGTFINEVSFGLCCCLMFSDVSIVLFFVETL
jgi:hypothetical protein